MTPAQKIKRLEDALDWVQDNSRDEAARLFVARVREQIAVDERAAKEQRETSCSCRVRVFGVAYSPVPRGRVIDSDCPIHGPIRNTGRRT